jgi:hypothetical protein
MWMLGLKSVYLLEEGVVRGDFGGGVSRHMWRNDDDDSFSSLEKMQ